MGHCISELHRVDINKTGKIYLWSANKCLVYLRYNLKHSKISTGIYQAMGYSSYLYIPVQPYYNVTKSYQYGHNFR